MKVLIIGFGSVGAKHAKVLREIRQDIEIFALRSDSSKNKIENVHEIYSYKDIPDDIDFIIISNPTSIHEETISRLINVGKPLFIEKPPVAAITGSTLELADKIEKCGIQTYVAFNLRFHPCIKFLKEEISRNKLRINELSIYCGSYLPDWRPGTNYMSTYSVSPLLGGGVHLDLIHEIDYTIYLFGKPVKVTSHFRSSSSLGIKSFDHAHYYLEYPGFSAMITLNYFRTEPRRTIEIVFKDKVWNVDLIKSTISNNKGEIIFSENIDPLFTYREQMKSYLEKKGEEKSGGYSFRESLDILRICLNDTK